MRIARGQHARACHVRQNRALAVALVLLPLLREELVAAVGVAFFDINDELFQALLDFALDTLDETRREKKRTSSRSPRTHRCGT